VYKLHTSFPECKFDEAELCGKLVEAFQSCNYQIITVIKSAKPVIEQNSKILIVFDIAFI